MIKVEEMCMRLGSASGKPIKQSDVLVLGMNGMKSKLLLSDFVKGYSHTENEVRGYSILFTRKTELVDNRIKFNEDVVLSLFRESDEEEIVIAKIYPHWFQGSDKEVDVDLQKQIIGEEYKRLTDVILEEVKEEISEVEEEEIMQEVATEDGYKSNTHKAICILAGEAVELAQKEGSFMPEELVLIDNAILAGGKIFEMNPEEEGFKAIKQAAKDAGKFLGVSEPVEFKYTQEVQSFITVLLGNI